MPDFREFLRAPNYSKIRIALMVLGIFLILEIAARIYFLRPRIVTRSAGNNDQAMNYLLDEYARYKGKGIRVACIGSSVMQGYINAFDDKAFPSMAEQILRQKYGYPNLRTFNFAVAGNNFGDHICVLNRVLQDPPDVIVHAIHFKLFSTHMNTAISRASNVYYLLGADNFGKLLARFNISPKQFIAIYIDKTIGAHIKLYGNRDLITHLITGSDRVAMQQVTRAFQASFGFLSEEAILAQLHTPAEHNQEYLWKLLPESLMKQNYEICGNFNFSDENPAWLSFIDENKLAKDHEKTIMWYLTPMNKAFIEEAHFFEWDKIVPIYKKRVWEVTRRYNHELRDYSQGVVDTAYFSDTDHINMAGHQQVAARLAKDIDQMLKTTRRRR